MRGRAVWLGLGRAEPCLSEWLRMVEFPNCLLGPSCCPSCSVPLDDFGFHPGTCKKGNAGYAWTLRSEALEGALAFVARRMNVHAVRS